MSQCTGVVAEVRPTLPRMKCLSLLLWGLVIFGCLMGSTGCGNDDSSRPELVSTIHGNVAEVVAAMVPDAQQPTRFAALKNLFTLVRIAHAQNDGLAGITVTVQQGDEILSSATTDFSGDFVLDTPAGNVTLTFETATFTIATNIIIPEESTVILVVVLRPTQVTTPTRIVLDNDGEDELAPLRCETGTINLGEIGRDFVIDGRGGDCLRAVGNCALTLDFDNITLLNCERCVRAEGNAVVTFTTPGELICEANADGIRAEGTAEVTLNVTGLLDIEADEHGVRAGGAADVLLNAIDCRIDSGEEPLRLDGNATVNGCNF